MPLAVTGAAGAVSNLADSGLFFRLTRGRLWIATLTTLLVGIVALNVMELSFGASASSLARQADILKREDSTLRTRLAGTLSDERIQQVAGTHGLIQPPPGLIGYLTASSANAAVAAKRLRNGDLTLGAPDVPTASTDSMIPPPAATATTPAATTATTTSTTPTTTTATTTSTTPTTTTATTMTPTTTTATAPTTTTPTTTTTAGGVGLP